MTIKAYLIGSHFLCGLDQNDVAMPLSLKSIYKKANVMYVSSSIVGFTDAYFANTTCKESVVKRNMRKVETIAETVALNDNWPALCLVDISELEELSQKLIHKLNLKKNILEEKKKITATLVDLNDFDLNFDDENYYDRFPHVRTEEASYVGILRTLEAVGPNDDNQAPSAFRSNDHRRDDTEATNVALFDENADNAVDFIVAARPDQLQLVPYVASVEEDDEEEDVASVEENEIEDVASVEENGIEDVASVEEEDEEEDEKTKLFYCVIS